MERPHLALPMRIRRFDRGHVTTLEERPDLRLVDPIGFAALDYSTGEVTERKGFAAEPSDLDFGGALGEMETA